MWNGECDGSTGNSRGPALCSARFRTCGLAVIITAALIGCGDGRVPVVPVSGKVTFEGKPPSGALVTFYPVGHTLPNAESATGTVKDDGSVEVNVYEGGGVPAGDYTATFVWFKVVPVEGGAGRGPNVLPKEYADAATSPVKVTVKPEPTVLDPIEIVAKK
jgi:hypothetical protein